jgi:hypothetical protein
MERLQFQWDICKMGAARRVFMSWASFSVHCSSVIFALTVFPLLFWGCSDDKFGSDSSSGKQISFRLQGNLPSSRATGTTVENINAFVVNAQVHDKNDYPLPDDADKLFSSQTVARQEGQFNAFDYNPKRYYPDAAEKAYYSAYSPVTGNVGGFNGSPDNTITYRVPAPSDKGDTTQEDLLVAYTPVIGKAVTLDAAPSSRDGFDTPVSLNFKHALSRVFVKASNKNLEPVVITGLILHNLYNEGMLKIDGAINEEAADYKVLWERTDRESEKLTSYPYVLLPTGVSVPAGTEDNPVYVVGKDQGMLVLPQTTVNSNNDAEIDDTEVSTDFYVEVTYRLSNIQRTVRAAFTDINKLAQGLTFEMGRQYALTLGFSDAAVEFDISVEPWEADEQLANAATTVVFNGNKPSGALGAVSHIHDTNSGFIYGKALPALYYDKASNPDPDTDAPTLAGYVFQGYFDAREGGTPYYDASLTPQKVFDTDGDDEPDAVWDKAGPSSTLYAQWEEEVWGKSNIYFAPDEPDGNIGSLTFSENDPSKSGLQGLYFKWGSLIGVAAGGSNESYDNTIDSGTYLYIPNVVTGKYYKVRSGLVSKDYSAGTTQEMNEAVRAYADKQTDGTWDKIPYVTDVALGGSIESGRGKAPLTEKSGAATYDKYMGDICKFLSEKKATNDSRLKRNWVMPKSEVWSGENRYVRSYWPYSHPSGWSYDWVSGYLDNTTPDGRDKSTACLTYTLAANGETVTFPAAGCRYEASGNVQHSLGNFGYYWSSSVDSSIAYSLFFSASGDMYPANLADWNAMSLRCVRDL